MIIKRCIYISIFALSLSIIQTSHASLGFLKVFIAHKHENCAKGLPTDDGKFCSVFRSVAECHCTSSGLPRKFCQNIETLYERMLSVFETEEKACAYQQDTDTQNCLDSWKCYRVGGKDSQGRLCSSTGKPCRQPIA